MVLVIVHMVLVIVHMVLVIVHMVLVIVRFGDTCFYNGFRAPKSIKSIKSTKNIQTWKLN